MVPALFSRCIFEWHLARDIGHIHDPDLKELVESLPMIALRSKAPAKVKKYAGGFNRWRKWADSKPGIDQSLSSLLCIWPSWSNQPRLLA